MRKAVSAAIVGLALLVSSAATAGPRQGSNELLLSGGFFHRQGADDGNLNLDLSYGYYLTPGWQVGFRQAVNYNFIDDARELLFDPQTSGGLLIALPAEQAATVQEALLASGHGAATIGRVLDGPAGIAIR